MMEDLSQKFKEISKNEKVEKISAEIGKLTDELNSLTSSTKKKFDELEPEKKKMIIGGIIGFVLTMIGIGIVKKALEHKDKCCK
jgi:hypothetical protein